LATLTSRESTLTTDEGDVARAGSLGNGSQQLLTVEGLRLAERLLLGGGWA
jgi:hypothetical protein